VEDGGRNRYQRAKGERCQFPGVLHTTIAAVLGVGRLELIDDFVHTMAAKDRVKLDDSQPDGVQR
jgi:hypothetical protein